MSTIPRDIVLREFEKRSLPSGEITGEMGKLLYEKYGKYLDIEFPSPPTGYQWKILPRGWMGYIPVSDELRIILEPKVELSNLFLMLEHAYKLEIKFMEGIFDSDSLDEFYDRLALRLSKLVLDRTRKGLHRNYDTFEEVLPYVRGRINVVDRARKPWTVNFESQFQEHTMDIEDNQILFWTLHTIGRSGLCRSSTRSHVREAFHKLEGYVSLQSFQAENCRNRTYHRLNEDYRNIHNLCAFFLEQTGPGHKLGEKSMQPFLVNMNNLFEVFVAEWLRENLPEGWSLKVKKTVYLSRQQGESFQIDLVLIDERSGLIKMVLDTKYKNAASPAADDISQVIAYADTVNCEEAVLIYPAPLKAPFDVQPGRTRVRGLWFDLKGDLSKNGKELVSQIIQ
jgi:5-methylcytosine-specific restriction enzyme subunit McrC